MAGYGLLGGVAVVLAIITFGIPWIVKEYFPWRSLWAQRHGRPTVTTQSYKGRTALITGANGAFGSRAAKLFAHREIDTLVLVDVMDCGRVKKEIEEELTDAGKPVPRILVWKIDMMTFEGCQQVGQKARELKYLDHVLLTAGILAFNRRESPEGWETCKSAPSLPTLIPPRRCACSSATAGSSLSPRKRRNGGHVCAYISARVRLYLSTACACIGVCASVHVISVSTTLTLTLTPFVP